MQVEAIYDKGRLEFTRPIQLKNDRLRVLVEVPEEAIVNPSSQPNVSQQLQDQAQNMLDKLASIRMAPLEPEDELPEITPKQQERIEAFELRVQIREQQGRPA